MSSGTMPLAVRKVLERAAAGDAEALFQRGMWQLVGAPLARDLPAARADFTSAANLGHGEAGLVAAALLANGSGGPVSWAGATKLLRTAALSFSPARSCVAILDAMQLDADGAPRTLPSKEDLTGADKLWRVRNFLTSAECAHVVNCVADLLQPAVVADPRTGRNMPHPVRTSDAAIVSPLREDPVLRAIARRIAVISDTLIDQGEALTLLRYRPGQQFRLHSDALPGAGNQRVKTVLLYLNDGYDGGQTIFPDHGVTVSPIAGDAIVFCNTLADGRPDPTMRHAGLPVLRGEKWLATRWIRARPFDVWSGPEAARSAP